MNTKIAWIVQECPSALLPLAIVWTGGENILTQMDMKAKILGAGFIAHYIHRSFFFPLAIRPSKATPIIVAVLAFMFNIQNSLLQASMWLQHQHWHSVGTVQFWLGIIVWVVGACTNMQADYHLVQLKKAQTSPGALRPVPWQGIFHYVSGGSYLGEIIEWLGYCIAANHIAALSFWAFVVCNIGPRAFHYHHAYLQLYPDYPKTRKALIPGIL